MSLIVSIIPGLLWLAFFYNQDNREPEPKRLVLRAFMYGILAVPVAGFLEFPVRGILREGTDDLIRLALVAVFVIGLVEETLKYLAVRVSAYDSPYFDEAVDGIIYSVSAALGFASAENFLYTMAFGISVGVFRALVTTLAHASFSGIMGYYLGQAKLVPEEAIALTAKGLSIAILLHGLYDFIFLGELVPPVFGILLVVLLYYHLTQSIRMAKRL